MSYDFGEWLFVAFVGTLLIVVGFVIGAEVGSRKAIEQVHCPMLLTDARSLTDSLAVAQRYEECEWWTDAPRP